MIQANIHPVKRSYPPSLSQGCPHPIEANSQPSGRGLVHQVKLSRTGGKVYDQASETTAGVPQCLNLIYNSLRVGLELVILAFIFNEEVYLDVKTLLCCLIYEYGRIMNKE